MFFIVDCKIEIVIRKRQKHWREMENEEDLGTLQCFRL